MTKRRAPVSPELAITRIAGHIGWDRCADLAQVCERTVRRWSDPDTPEEISFKDAVNLDTAFIAAGGGSAPLLETYQLLLEMGAAAACASSIERAKAAARAAKENGEALQAQILASVPGACPGTIEIARRETEEAITAHADVLVTLSLDKPKHLRGPEVPPAVRTG